MPALAGPDRTSASLSAAFTSAFDPASSAPAQVWVECYQALIQSPNIPLEHVCLLIPMLLSLALPPMVVSLRGAFSYQFFFILPLPFLPLISRLISLSGRLGWLRRLGYPRYVYGAYMFVDDSDDEQATTFYKTILHGIARSAYQRVIWVTNKCPQIWPLAMRASTLLNRDGCFVS